MPNYWCQYSIERFYKYAGHHRAGTTPTTTPRAGPGQEDNRAEFRFRSEKKPQGSYGKMFIFKTLLI